MSLKSTRFSSHLSLIICLTINFVSCQSKPEAPKQKQNPPVIVDVMVATLQKVENVVEANGTVVANENVELHPEGSGRLTYLNIPEGKFVKRGTVLARINSADLQAQYQKSKVQLELNQKTVERLGKLLAVNGINQNDYDVALNQANSTKADMAYTETLIDKTVIRAPFDGTLGLRQVSPGAYVSPTTVIATLQQLGQLKIDFTIPEEYSNLVKVGGIVDVEVDAAKNIRQRARIIAIEPQVNSQTRNLMVRAILSGNTSNPGAFVKVYVGGNGSGKMAVMVPTNTIIPNDVNNQLILIKKGKGEFVNVSTGIRLANNVEITKGVNAGDTVVVTGVLFVRPNSKVKIRSIKTLEQADKNQ
ncbi:MAG: efflux RND transporter periplasmic adaptor subunit [Bacteroidota bacterium]|nr:efflux RND transporter periplasmic adaptor subunit [Bacteroidota bacterium]